MVADCGADWATAPACCRVCAFNFVRPVIPGLVLTHHPGMTEEGSFASACNDEHYSPILRIAFLASDSPISTKAEVTSGPPTRIRVGVFILFHS
jgi:hypothetical protein